MSMAKKLLAVFFLFVLWPSCKILPLLNMRPEVYIDNPIFEYNDQLVATFKAHGTDSDGDIINYRWDYGDGTTSSGLESTVIHKYPVKGIYYVVVIATDDDGLDSIPAGKRAIIPGTNQPPFAVIRTNLTEGQEPLTVIFDGSGSFDSDPDDKVESFIWNFGDGSEGVGITVDHVFFCSKSPFTCPKIFEVTLTVIDKFGIPDSANIFINVLANK